MLKTKEVRFVYSEASDCESIQLDDKELGWVIGHNSDYAVMWKDGRESRLGFVTLSAAKEYVKREVSPVNYLVFDEVVTRRISIPEGVAGSITEAEEYLDCLFDPHQDTEVLHREISEVVEIQNSDYSQKIANPEAFKAPEDTPKFKSGDYVLYNGKPRQVYKFFQFGETEEFPDITRDSRFDMVELVEVKKLVYTRDVQRMIVEEGAK